MEPLFELPIARSERASTQSLCAELRAAIRDGRLAPGARLPSTRRASAVFGVSRGTLAEVYETLLIEGHVVSRRGSGTYVAVPPASQPVRPAAGEGRSDPRVNPFWLSPETHAGLGFWRDPADDLPAAGEEIEFRPALVDARLFPFDVYRRISAARMRRLERGPARYRSDVGSRGSRALREAIVRHIALTRAVVCTPGDLLVTSGAQQAFDLIARVLVTPGKTVVAVEEPGYPPMRVAFAAAGAHLVPVPVDAEGMIVDALPVDVGIICVCPSHQFPLGMTMSPARRRALAAVARERGAVIVEDDYDGEFRFEGSPLEALRTPDNSDIVCYVGTFSKSMLPAFRLGFIAAPAWAMPALVAAKNGTDWHSSLPAQLGVAGFIAEGHLARHVRHMRGIYKRRREHLAALIASELGTSLEAVPSSYGMHVTAVSPDGRDLEAVAGAAACAGVRLHALGRYHLAPPSRQGLVFGYGVTDLPQIERGIAVLRQLLA